MNKEEKLLYSLSAIKQVIETFDIDIEITATKDGNEYVINAYNEIEKCVVDYVNSLQPYKFEDLKVGMWVYDIKPEYEDFRFIKITKILSKEECKYLYNDENAQVFFDNQIEHAREFEEGRYFPIIKAMEEFEDDN